MLEHLDYDILLCIVAMPTGLVDYAFLGRLMGVDRQLRHKLKHDKQPWLNALVAGGYHMPSVMMQRKVAVDAMFNFVRGKMAAGLRCRCCFAKTKAMLNANRYPMCSTCKLANCSDFYTYFAMVPKRALASLNYAFDNSGWVKRGSKVRVIGKSMTGAHLCYVQENLIIYK